MKTSPLNTITLSDVVLEGGEIFPSADIAFLTLGSLNASGDNAVLVTHGLSSGPAMIEPGAPSAEGSWSALVRPGGAIDTDRYFVVCPNMLGSAYGSTNAASLDPRSGRPYGPRFPSVTIGDIVASQRRLLERLGVRRLKAVAGPSYGGMLAFQWGVDHPDFIDGIVPALCALTAPPINLDQLIGQLAKDPNWNGGDYYGSAGMADTLTAMRMRTLKAYGVDTLLADTLSDEGEREARLERMAREWATEFDANSMVILMRALETYDVRPRLALLKARVLYVLSRTDQLFPPALAQTVLPLLQHAGVRAEYFEIDSPHGHFASGDDAGLWSKTLHDFLEGL